MQRTLTRGQIQGTLDKRYGFRVHGAWSHTWGALSEGSDAGSTGGGVRCREYRAKTPPPLCWRWDPELCVCHAGNLAVSLALLDDRSLR